MFLLFKKITNMLPFFGHDHSKRNTIGKLIIERNGGRHNNGHFQHLLWYFVYPQAVPVLVGPSIAVQQVEPRIIQSLSMLIQGLII